MYRASRFVKRNRLSVGAAALVVALLVGYTLTVALQERRIQAEAERAREAVAFVTQMFNSSERGEFGAGRASALDVIDQGAQRAGSALAVREMTNGRYRHYFVRVEAPPADGPGRQLLDLARGTLLNGHRPG